MDNITVYLQNGLLAKTTLVPYAINANLKRIYNANKFNYK